MIAISMFVDQYDNAQRYGYRFDQIKFLSLIDNIINDDEQMKKTLSTNGKTFTLFRFKTCEKHVKKLKNLSHHCHKITKQKLSKISF
ncbi:hypothetical protein DERP_011995 [Dermatophagoides pteronyssinus]|uniref:Uncharacterized protein n=1 Tax=Dermatophagoides pteronyssinus TaxID=6956 RepID=A0ABQ8IVJ3_DERPT|nr:hypothetical protein DERP_011995 [Dermatophagoides pteronyssinus]